MLRIGCYHCFFLCVFFQDRNHLLDVYYFFGTESDSDSVLFNEFPLRSLRRAIVTPEFPRHIHWLLIRTVTAHKKLFVSKFDTLFLYCSLVAATPSERASGLCTPNFFLSKKSDFFSFFVRAASWVIFICTMLFV